jgi:hypothetical protein
LILFYPFKLRDDILGWQVTASEWLAQIKHSEIRATGSKSGFVPAAASLRLKL